MGRKYQDVSATVQPDGWSEWLFPVQKSYRLACCDCGLVHEMDFKVVDGRTFFKIRRDNRATAALRRGKKPTLNLTFLRLAKMSLLALYGDQPTKVKRQFLEVMSSRLFGKG